MKILKIENNEGLYSLDGQAYVSIDKINKEDLLKLIDLALDPEGNIEVDDFDGDLIKDPAHVIIYKNISEKIKDLNQKKEEFKDESDRMYLPEYEKYKNSNK